MGIKPIVIWLGNKIAYSFTFGILFLGGIGYFLVTHYSGQAVPTHAEKLKIGFTSGGPVRAGFLKAVAEEGKLRGIDYELISTQGTEETVQMIADGRLDFGLIVGGVEASQAGDQPIREAMPIYVEPLHLLVKNEIFKATSESLWNLKGHTVNLGGQLTGTHVVAWELLRFAGLIDAQNHMQFTPSYIHQEELAAATDRRQLPDAIFLLAGIPSVNVQKLVTDFGYRLLDLPFHEALTLDRFKTLASASAVDGTRSRLNKQFLHETSIPAFTYGIQPPVPQARLKTFGARLTFITQQNMDAGAVRHLIEVVLSPNVAQLASPPLQRDLLLTPYEFKPHPGVSQYLNADKHLTLDDIFGFFQNVLQKWGIVIGIYMLLQKLLRQVLRKKEGVEKYMREVMEIEKEWSSNEGGVSPEQLAGLRTRLQEIRLKMMSAYVNRNLKDPQQFNHALKAVQLADQNLAHAGHKYTIVEAQWRRSLKTAPPAI